MALLRPIPFATAGVASGKAGVVSISDWFGILFLETHRPLNPRNDVDDVDDVDAPPLPTHTHTHTRSSMRFSFKRIATGFIMVDECW